MAFRNRNKEMKKQSYYVWFLGAQESRGLRGEEYIGPALRHLLERERELEPSKVTLQVSSKGLKIVQSVPRKGQVKHSVPHHAITCAVQQGDVVCCILLLYNPLTRCPVHVHAYRCDSAQTASTLRAQLQRLVDRPENQKKFREIENRLAAKGLMPRPSHSDGRSTRTEGSDRTEDSSGGSSEREVRKEHINSLYDSLAAELRERLSDRNSCPILLPPRDYDTVSRRQGRLDGIDSRRATHCGLTGLKDSTSNRSSSGIGSDEALSSAIQEVTFETKDPGTSSEEEEDWPPEEDEGEGEEEVEEEDEEEEVVPTYDWRRPPGRYSANRSSPEEDKLVPRGVRGIVDKFERRTVSPPQGSPIKVAARRSDPYADAPGRTVEVVHRRHSNPIEKKGRPVSYPAAPLRPEAVVHRFDRYPHADYYRDSRPLSSSPVRQFRSPERMPDLHRQPRQGSMTDVRQERAFPSRFVEPYPNSRQSAVYHPHEERRRSGYFDLPVDPRDYRHSFVESPFRRLPLNTQY